VVMGRAWPQRERRTALSHVAGLSIVTTCRRAITRGAGVAPTRRSNFDWVSQKSFDGALPFGRGSYR